jgi:Lrp/AsnC family transcriptional regulator, leucine-responsive regulatory protein
VCVRSPGHRALAVKVRTASPRALQDTLRRIYYTDGITGTEAIMVLETFFERPPGPREPRPQVA